MKDRNTKMWKKTNLSVIFFRQHNVVRLEIFTENISVYILEKFEINFSFSLYVVCKKNHSKKSWFTYFFTRFTSEKKAANQLFPSKFQYKKLVISPTFPTEVLQLVVPSMVFSVSLAFALYVLPLLRLAQRPRRTSAHAHNLRSLSWLEKAQRVCKLGVHHRIHICMTNISPQNSSLTTLKIEFFFARSLGKFPENLIKIDKYIEKILF